MTMPLQTRLPFDPTPRALPGIQPLPEGGWLCRDEAFAEQMALRDRLLAERRDSVLWMEEGAHAAAEELLQAVLDLAYPGHGAAVTRPDGVVVPIDRGDPLATAARLVQEDLCLLQRRGDEHVLTGAALCFPASWTLAEKAGRPLIGIHDPVATYDETMARRVQRLFDGVQAGRPLWRFNRLWYADADLHQPRSEGQRRPRADPETAPYFRSERQCIFRLPESGAVVFTIHTFVLARADALRVLGDQPV